MIGIEELMMKSLDVVIFQKKKLELEELFFI